MKPKYNNLGLKNWKDAGGPNFFATPSSRIFGKFHFKPNVTFWNHGYFFLKCANLTVLITILAKKTCKKSLSKNNEKQQLKTIAKNAFFSILSIYVINTWEKPCKNLEKKTYNLQKKWKNKTWKKTGQLQKRFATKNCKQKTGNEDLLSRLFKKTCKKACWNRLLKILGFSRTY